MIDLTPIVFTPRSPAHLSEASPSVAVVVPTYNEADNLPRLVAELFALPIEDLRVVVVDDNSPDGTGRLLEELREQYPRLSAIHRAGKLGLGSAYRQGFRYALERGADFVVQMDADFSHSPADVIRLLDHAAGFDVVVGSRYVEGGRLDPSWSWWRYRLSWWANSIWVRLFLRLDVQDATGGFKCWSRQALQAVLAHPVRSSGYIFQVEMAYLAQKLGLCALEIPIYFEDRRTGRSKMSTGIKLEAMWRTLFLPWQYRRLEAKSSGGRGRRVPLPLERGLTHLPSPIHVEPDCGSRSNR